MAIEASMNPLGKVIVDDDALLIRGPLSKKSIPYERITSVESNALTSTLKIETGAQQHRIQLWNMRRVSEIREAIEARMRERQGAR